MSVKDDDFRALARSSPWLVNSVDFVWRADSEVFDVRLRRPGVLHHRSGGGWVTLREPEVQGVRFTLGSDGASSSGPHAPGFLADQPVTRRPDGLVLARPDAWAFVSDPMVTNYFFVAALDPAELAEGVDLSRVREGNHHGRTVWTAECRPVTGYEPRCGCCPLLWSAISDEAEYGTSHPARGPYPESYTVSLDRETGLVVSIVPGPGSQRTDLGLDLRITAVG